jgi:hypothetical protein
MGQMPDLTRRMTSELKDRAMYQVENDKERDQAWPNPRHVSLASQSVRGPKGSDTFPLVPSQDLEVQYRGVVQKWLPAANFHRLMPPGVDFSAFPTHIAHHSHDISEFRENKRWV